MRHFKGEWRAWHALLLGAAVFAFLQCVVIFRTHAIYWDEAVFLTMGKFLATGGSTGFWEHIRPPVLPLLVGSVFHTGAAVLLTKLVLVLLATLTGFLLYQLLVPHVKPAIAAAASLLLLFSQIWFAYANLVLTDVLSASLMVIAVWLYTRNRLFLAGVIAAAAFLTRFPAGMLLIGLLTAEALLLHRARRNAFSRPALLLLGFSLPVLLWLGCNAAAWHDEVPLAQAALRPLIDGFTTASAENAGLYHVQPGFYALYIAQKLPVLLLGLFGLLWLRRLPAGAPLAIAALVGLPFFEWLPNDQLRFLALLLPGLVLLAAWGAQIVADRFSVPKIAVAAFCVSLAFALVDDVGLAVQQREDPPELTAYYSYLAENPVDGLVLVSDPVVAWHAPNKAIPLYYGLFAYADAYLPAVDAAAVQRHNTVCYDAACAAAVQRNWALLRTHYTPVHEVTVDGRQYSVYLRDDLLG